MLLDDIIAEDNKLIRSKFQTKSFSCIKITIVPVQEATITPFLYDVGDGRVFGENTIVDVNLFDTESKRKNIEMIGANITISAFRWIRDIVFPKTLHEALAGADYVILNPHMSRKKLSFKYAMLDQAQFFSIMGQNIEGQVKKTAWVIVVTPSYTSLFCSILKSNLHSFPANRITGLKTNIEVLAKNMIANKLLVPPEQVRGIAIWGENIIDFRMATVRLPGSSTIHISGQDQHTGGGDGKEVPEENQATCSQPYTSSQRNKDCKYCQDTRYFRQCRLKNVSKDKVDDSRVETGTEVWDKCYSIKRLQDEIMVKIGEQLNAATSKCKRQSITKCTEQELVELYQSVPVLSDETKHYLNLEKEDVNVVPVTQMISDQYWLMKYLPKICLKGSSRSGGSLARCLAEHIGHLHGGSRKPFNLMAVADDAYEFPRDLYVSGPGIVDNKTGTIAFFPFYDMSENTQLKLFRQVTKLKKQYLQLERKFWTNEDNSFDTKKIPLYEKDEFGFVKKSRFGRHSFERTTKKKFNSFDVPNSVDVKPSSTVSSLARIIQFHEQEADKMKKEHEREMDEAKCKEQIGEIPKPFVAHWKLQEIDEKIGKIIRSVLK